jgi:outer membrane lipoprotein SlyB
MTGFAPPAQESTMTEQKIIEHETVIDERPATTIETTSVSSAPRHGDEEVGGAVTGGIAGAAIGAVVGGPVGAVVGGAIGAASGATIGAVDTRKKDQVDEVVVTREVRRP